MKSSFFASQLRLELCQRNRKYARGRLHVESYGGQPVVVYAPENERHGNFFDAAYGAIATRPEWMKRFNKIHAQGRALPKPTAEPSRKWRELDSSMSSDALLMNVFCTPGVVESSLLRNVLGVDAAEPPVFGWKARVPLKSGLLDRTEVDMKWGSLQVEAKLTEGDFQSRTTSIVEAYRDLDEVFDCDLLSRVEIPVGRRKETVEFPEDYSQEWEETAPLDFQPPIRTIASPTEPAYGSYQLIRNVLAAYAHQCCFCVIHDERRPDLREVWYQVMAAVKSAEMRVRLKVLTWQELSTLVPAALQYFLDLKYGIVAPGKIASPIQDRE
jgi:hypothetical protein